MGKIACKGHQDFFLGSDGGFRILVHSKIGENVELLVKWHGRQELILVYIEDNIFNFYLKRVVKSTENGREINVAEQCSRWYNENAERGHGYNW